MTKVPYDTMGVTVGDGASVFVDSLANEGLLVCASSGWWLTVADFVTV